MGFDYKVGWLAIEELPLIFCSSFDGEQFGSRNNVPSADFHPRPKVDVARMLLFSVDVICTVVALRPAYTQQPYFL